MRHGGVVKIADPGGDEVVGSVADGPVVAKVVGGAGFYGDFRVVGDVKVRAKGRGSG